MDLLARFNLVELKYVELIYCWWKFYRFFANFWQYRIINEQLCSIWFLFSGKVKCFCKKTFDQYAGWHGLALVVFYRTLKETPLTIWTPKIYSYAYLIATTLNILFTRHHCKCKTIAAFLLYQLLAKPSLPAMTLCEWIHFYLISFTVCWCSIMWKCEAEKHIFVSALQFSLRKSYLTYRTLNDIHCLFFVGFIVGLLNQLEKRK